jgi:hypothetical protein
LFREACTSFTTTERNKTSRRVTHT